MENLFIPSASFDTTEYHVLPEDRGEWSVEIMRKFYEQVPPDISNIPSKVVFTNENAEAMVGTGSVILQANPQISFPFVVKPKGDVPTLSPLDIFMSEGEMFPFSPQNLMRKISGKSLNAKLGPKKGKTTGGRVGALIDRGSDDSNSSIDQLLAPPAEMRSVGASFKYSSEGGLLNNALETATPSHLKEAFDTISDDPTRLALQSKHPDILESIVNAMRSRPEGVAGPPVRVIQIRRLSMKGFPVKVLREGGEAEEKHIQNMDGLKRLLSSLPCDPDPALTSLYSTGDYTWLRKTANDYAGVNTSSEVVEANTDSRVQGYVEVESEAGEKTTGWLIPQVSDFEGNIQDASLFIGQDFSGYQESYTARTMEKHPPLADSAVLEGKKGAFVSYESGRMFSTIPFDVKAVSITPTEPVIHVDTFNHGRIKLIPSKEAAMIIPIGEDTFMIPDYYKFMEVTSLKPIKSYGKTLDLEKAAASDHDIMRVHYNGTFTFEGYPSEKLAKYAGEIKGVDAMDTKFVLACAGYMPEDADRIIKEAIAEGCVELKAVNIDDPETMMKEAMDESSLLHASTEIVRVNLFKEAAVLDDSATVDSLLSLNFVNPENIGMFVASLPWFGMVLKALAKVLMASRLGLPVPEAAAKKAMTELLRVSEALENLAIK